MVSESARRHEWHGTLRCVAVLVLAQSGPAQARDRRPPALTDVRVESITPDGAEVVFTSNEPVVPRVVFGRTAEYGGLQRGSAGTRVWVPQLDEGTRYHYQLTVRDRAGNETSTEDLSLCTPSAADLQSRRLLAEYHRGVALDEVALRRTEATIDQPRLSNDSARGDFGSGAGSDRFSARWTGLVRLVRAGRYEWTTTSDDGQRLWIDGAPLINNWSRQSRTTKQARITLDAGWHALRYEMFKHSGTGFARVQVQGPGMRRQILPTGQLARVRDSFFRPTIVPRDREAEVECTSSRGASVELPPLEHFDCRDPQPSLVRETRQDLPLGQSRVRWLATNRWGLQTRLVEFVRVVDTRPPEIEAVEALEVDAGLGAWDELELPVPAASDVCDAAPEITHHVCTDDDGEPCRACWGAADEADDPTRTTGSRNQACACAAVPPNLEPGVTVLTAIATDASGNCASTTFPVTVRDATPPFVAAEEPVFVCGSARIPTPLVRDNVSAPEDIVVRCLVDGEDAPTTCDRSIGFPAGEWHWVEYRATDEAENERRLRVTFLVGAGDPIAPEIRLVQGPPAWSSGQAQVRVEATDNCDASPRVDFAPAASTLETEAGQWSATYLEEGVFCVDVVAQDAAGGEATVSDLRFGIDRTAPTVGLTGLPVAEDDNDTSLWPSFGPGDLLEIRIAAADLAGAAGSGLAAVVAELEDVETGVTHRFHTSSFSLQDDELPSGPAQVKNLRCDDSFEEGDTWCDASGNLLAAALACSVCRLRVRVDDVAGNSAEIERHFTILDWPAAIRRAADRAQGLLELGGLSPFGEIMAASLVELREPAAQAASDVALTGNALLYTYAISSTLDSLTEWDRVDSDSHRTRLSQAAFSAMRQFNRDTADALGDDDPDVRRAADLMADARDFLQRETPAHLATLLALQNAYFWLRHATAPYDIGSTADALAAGSRIAEELEAYLDLESATEGVMAPVAELQRSILDDRLFTSVLQRNALPEEVVNEAFVDLLVRLNELAAMLEEAQSHFVWVRNWQWPVALQVRELVGAGFMAAALELGEDPGNPRELALAEARSLYDTGVGLIDGRRVDDALDIYVNARCLIYEIYNLANFQPRAVPPEDWRCDECVLTGLCER